MLESNESSKISFYVTLILAGIVLIAIWFLTTFVQITCYDQFKEGYSFAINLLLFDGIIVFPVYKIITYKNRTLKLWTILTVLGINLTIGMGYQYGSLIGLFISVAAIYVHLKFCRNNL